MSMSNIPQHQSQGREHVVQTYSQGGPSHQTTGPKHPSTTRSVSGTRQCVIKTCKRTWKRRTCFKLHAKVSSFLCHTHNGIDGRDSHHVGIVQQLLVRVRGRRGGRIVAPLLTRDLRLLSALLRLWFRPCAASRRVGGGGPPWHYRDPIHG